MISIGAPLADAIKSRATIPARKNEHTERNGISI